MIPTQVRTRILAISMAVAVGAMVMPAQAQRTSLADRVSVLEQRASNTQGNVDLLNQVNALKAEVSQLRAQIEELQHEGKQAQSSAQAQYLDLDGRLNRLEGGASAGAPPAPSPTGTDARTPAEAPAPADATGAAEADAGTPSATAPAVPAADERASYDAAFDVLKAGRYDESARAFDQFLQQHPNGAYAPNAHYWLGESYYVTQNYELALEQFKLLYQRYPQHDKAAGALLKVGLSQYGLKQLDAAQATLAQVGEKFPGSDAARTADDRLRAIELSR